MQKELEAIEFPSSEGGENFLFTKKGNSGLYESTHREPENRPYSRLELRIDLIPANAQKE